MTDTKILRIVRNFFILALVLFFAGTVIVVGSGLMEEKREETFNESLAAEIAGPDRIDGHDARLESMAAEREELNSRGDPGDDEFTQLTDKEKNAGSFDTGRAHSRKALIELALEYNGYIPFASGGRSFDRGFHKYASGIDNRGRAPELQTGLDSWGYILWLFRNTFGTLGDEWLDPETFAGTAAEVEEESLEVGDIGMLRMPEETGNHYGVCIGFLEGIPVFSHCANIPADRYPLGNSRLSFLSSGTGRYLQGAAPVGFTHFYRPPVRWEVER